MSLKDKLKAIPKSWSMRKGCFFCGGPLGSAKEKVLRSCNNCAQASLDGFDKMAAGNIKEGFTDVKKVTFGDSRKLHGEVEQRMSSALKNNRKKIEKKLRKKGLTEDQIKEGLAVFDESIK